MGNSNPNLTIEGIRELADVLPHTNIVRLVLTKVSMVDILLKVLCNAIVHTRLQVLEMNYNDSISIDGVRTLLNTLPHTYLIDVRLTNYFGLQDKINLCLHSNKKKSESFPAQQNGNGNSNGSYQTF